MTGQARVGWSGDCMVNPQGSTGSKDQCRRGAVQGHVFLYQQLYLAAVDLGPSMAAAAPAEVALAAAVAGPPGMLTVEAVAVAAAAAVCPCLGNCG